MPGPSTRHEATIHARIAAQAALSPNSPALITDRETLSYGELVRRSRALAQFLRQRGARLEEPIGVCLERSAELVVCLLAVLEAGATYLPLDPKYPRERIGFMLEDAQARLLLTRRELAAQTSGHAASSKLEPIFLEDLPPAPAKTPDFEEHAVAEGLSHLIYTSGSTGRPKGVAICHRNVTSFFDWATKVFPAEELRGVFAATSICFDLSIFELFFPLTRGGTVILGRDALHLPSHPARAEVTLVNTVPSAITELARQQAIPAGVITVNLAGEPLKRALTDAVYAAGVKKVYNLYGPSEDTTYSTWVLVPKGSAEEPTIGVPIDGSVGHVLGSDFGAVAGGEIGELYLGGLGVSRGYLGRPAQTAERYLPDPFSGVSGARLYRTGDRVRQREDGQLEFLGRVDHQVKIRGFRIELGEIEAALARHPAIEMPLALVREDHQGDPRIVAYFQQKAGLAEPSAQELREHLAELLPHFMVPSAFVGLARMPLTPNGKIDRNPLLALAPPSLEEGPFEAPQGELETALAALFADVLGVERVGRHDSFLALGGHSLLAARLASRIESELGRAASQRAIFEAPSVAELAAALEGGLAAAHLPIPPRDARKKAPLSAGQRGLFYLWQLDETSPQYATPVALRLAGELDVPALERAIASLIARHEALRCRFPRTAGVPEAVADDAAASAAAFRLVASDLRPSAAPFEQAMAAAREESRRGFDLETEVSFRVRLWRTGDAEHLLFFNLHHIITDGVSLEIFFDELGQLYAGERRGERVQLPPLEAGLLDTVAFLEAETTPGTEENLAFWRRHLEGARPLELPSDRPRPATPSHRGDAFRQPLDGPLVAALSEVGRPQGATFFLVASAAFHAWLTRLTGQDDTVLGVPVAGRNHPATRRQLGLFINALPVRVDAGGDPSFLELLARVRRRHLDAWSHEAMPMDRLVAELAPNRQLGRNPFFDLAFQVRDGYFGPGVLPGLRAEHVLVHNGTSKFDLDIALVRRGDELTVEVEYDLELFERATIESFLGSFLTLLEDVSRRPEARLSALAMVPAGQLEQLADWNATHGKAPLHLSLATLFRRAAARNPAATALEYAEETLSYEQLDHRSDALAHQLITAGVLPGDLVALAGEKSARQITGLLAIVKAGAAYVPLDVSYPRERLAFLLDDARPKVLLADRDALAELPIEAFEAGGGRTLALEEIAQEAPRTPAPAAVEVEVEVDGDFPAYVIYTSGSTGKPKGVVVPQRAIIRLVFDNRFLALSAEERIAQASNVSFDAATFEIWGALLHGACLVGVVQDTLLTADKLRAFLLEKRISSMWLTASLFHQYARQMPEVVASLGALLFGGERCDPEAVRKSLELGPKRLINGYGPTETTTFAATYEVREVPAGAVSVPIGRPIGETELYIVDRWLEPLPIGATGELLIGGAGLANAYLGRPGLTARSFVPHPFARTPGARLYRSGDLVRLRPDGLFDYVGRIDQQVKVRGFRVELGEIEALLGRHPAVAERAVALQNDGHGSGRLVAYVVPHAGQETSADALRAFLGQTLPEHLVPTAFQFLSHLPLTAHGKVDRRALPAFDSAQTGAPKPGRRPQSEIEKRIHDAWCQLFGVDALDVDAQFFAIGGHSLLAAQLLARLHQQFQIELPLRVVYDQPSIAAMARLIETKLLEKLTAPPAMTARQQATSREAPQPAPEKAAETETAEEDWDEETIRPLPPGASAPLSYGQRRLFFLHLLEPEASIYNLGFALELRGPLDREALEKALEEIERRHTILRTRYLNRAEGPEITVDPPAPFRFRNEDLRSLDPALRQERLQAELDREFNRGFDLQKGPIWRARLLRLDDDVYAFLYLLHHIATDGWSQGILSTEIAELYTAFRQGKASPLPELKLQYQDFAAWQERRFRRRESKALFDFWRAQLEGIEPAELTGDFPRQAEQTYRGASHDITWPPELMPKVRRFSQKNGCSPFVTCLSAFLVTLQAFCDRDDLAVGTVVGGRERNELEPVIGFFVNTLILRTRLDGDPTFVEAVNRVRSTFLAAHEHSELPFDQLVETLLPNRDLSRHPFVSMLFQVFDRELVPAIPGLATRLLEPNVEGAKMDLVATVLRRDYGYSVEIEFAADLYHKSTIDHFFRSFLVVLAAGIDSPSSRLSELPLLDVDQQELWRRLRDRDSRSPLDASLFELFARQVENAPDHPAIESAGRRLTRGELAELAHRIAWRLHAEGVRPGDVVGLALERSIELVAAILAVAEIGATYAPLDPGYPAPRLEFMIEDTAMPLLLTRAALKSALPIGGLLARGGRCVEIESIGSGAGELPRHRCGVPAMIIYTSGSTGRPKGVVVPQEGVVRLARDNGYLEIGPEDTLAHASNPSFDAASFEIWGALLNGARLVVIDTDTLLAAEKLRQVLQNARVTVLFLTTALFQQFTRQQRGAFQGLRAVLFGGERCEADVVRTALATSGAQSILHAYGPTETTTFATVGAIEQVPPGAGSVPIGQGIAFTETLVVDRLHRLLPPGAIGELVIGGPALAHGYLRRPELTARSFVPHPWSTKPGERLYRSGDLMRLRPDGALEFLGRIDNQVKLRGFRIELGEIENALARHPEIGACAVVLAADERGEPQLAAYFEAKTLPPPSGESLRAFLEDSLPAFYLPSFYLPLDALPLTPNGKVDRKKLAALRLATLLRGEEKIAPRSETESAIHQLWCELFAVESASVEANFFTSGGHSLLAARLLARIRDHFAVEIPMRLFFRRPTIAGLAASLENLPAGQLLRDEDPLPAGSLPTFSFGQRRLFFLYQLEPDSPSYNIPLAIELHGKLDVRSLERALETLLRRHDVLRTRYLHLDEEGPRLELDAPAPFVLPILDLQDLHGEAQRAEVMSRVDQEMQRPFHLERECVLRAQLLRLGEEHHVFQLTTHHIASDGWSQQILAEELASLYDAYRKGEENPLLPLAHQYSDYAVWLENWLQGERYEHWVGFWRQALAGMPALDLPTDYPRPEVQSQRGTLFTMSLPAARAQQIRAFARGRGETLFTVLLTALAGTLARYSGQNDFGIGTIVAGRPRTELESLVGFFVNTLVLRQRIDGDPTFDELLVRTRETYLDAQAHQEIPFEKLVEELRPPRDNSRAPFVQVVFQVVGMNLVPHLPGLSSTLLERHSGTSKFDFAITAHELGQDQELFLSVEYDTALFSAATVERLFLSFETLLMAATSNPSRSVRRLPMVSPADLARLESLARPLPYDATQTIPSLLARQMRATPERIALVHENDEITYAELAGRIARLAHLLRLEGVGCETIVAVCLERTPELVVALMAVLFAGGTYLPLDPAYPADRIEKMLEDTGARLLITQESLAERFPGHGLLILERLSERLAAQSEELPPPPPAMDPEQIAYLIYTSGSTGRPKGVAITHHNAVAFFAWASGEFSDEELSGVSATVSVCFDVSIFEIFFPITRGGTVILATNVLHILTLPARERIRLLTTVPSAITELLRLEGIPSSVISVGLPGEPLKQALVQQIFAVSKAQVAYNFYGPSEDTTYSTWARLYRGDQEEPPIGWPIANSRAYVVDAAGELLPFGLMGELYLGGDGVSRGYLNRPRITAERYLPDPFSGQPGARLYRTGDRTRWREDGQLLCFGRFDHQVKLRGFRIELGEIEAVLARHPAVGLTLAMVREDVAGDPRLVAYYTRRGEVAQQELREYLRRHLPHFMVPAFFVEMNEMPLNPNGKTDRARLPAPQESAPRPVEATPTSALTGSGTSLLLAEIDDLEDFLAAQWRQVLHLDTVGVDDNFFDLGGHSLLVPQLLKKLAGRFPALRLLDLFRFPTIGKLADHLRGGQKVEKGPRPEAAAAAMATSRDIAIIGVAGRFPQAMDIEELWRNILAGKEALSELSAEEMLASGVDEPSFTLPEYVKRGAVLEGIELFDAELFAMNAREAQITDPQHRLFLETAWEALERAGWAGEGQDLGSGGRIGVFAGTSQSGYFLHHVLSHPELIAELGTLPVHLGSDKDFLATRVAYKLDLTGPAMAVQTACSTSLVAAHLACRSLRDHECDLALAGGATVQIPHKTGYAYVSDSILSPDGHCRAFDAKAAGTLPSSGVGVVVLKRLEDAQRDGDHIVAVIRGSAINNDGAGKVGFTAPSIDGQARVIADALARAGVPARSVGYVECHGTGTQMGDPIEVAALEKVHRAESADRGYCAISSFKTQVGHMDSAAGVGGLIRAALAVERATIPPNLHFEQPNPELRLEQSPFFVPAEARPWASEGTPRRAGVSSFGIGGTNAHVVLEEAPAAAATTVGRPLQLLLLSARSEASLLAHGEKMAQHLEAHPELHSGDRLADVASTLHRGRRHFPHRLALLVKDGDEAMSLLRRPADAWHGLAAEAAPVAFLFPGQGAQYAGMGRDLYASEPIFRQEVDACTTRLESLLGVDLRPLLLARGEQKAAAQEKLQQTALAQPALFTIEWALANLWLSWGIVPSGLLGHSIGEYVAATLAGVFDRDAALALVAARGRRMQDLPAGKMLAIRLPEAAVFGKLIATGLAEEVTFAAINGPNDVVVSGKPEAIDAFAAALAKSEIEGRELKTSHAFHSPMMDGVLEGFREDVRKAAPQKPRRPFLSNLTGAPIDADLAVSPDYWARHLRHAVRFADGLSHLLADPKQVLLEVGPGRGLGTLARRAGGADRTILASLPHPQDERSEHGILLEAAAKLYTLGAKLSAEAFYAGQKRRRLPLPTTPFERRRYWLEARTPQAQPAAEPAPASAGAATPLEETLVMPSTPVAEGPLPIGPDLAASEPQDEIARGIEELWRNLLGAEEKIPFDLDFYEAGGDSLMATQLANRLRKIFGVVVRGNELMADALTIREQADLVRERMNEKD